MTKGRAALPLSVVAEQEPFSSTWVGPTAHDFSGRRTFPRRSAETADLSTTLLQSSGRDDKGEGALPLSVVAEQEPFSSTWVGPTAHDFSGRRTLPRRSATADLSTTLLRSSGRDDKGEGALPLSAVAEQEPFSSTSDGPTAHDFFGRRTFPGKVR